MRFNGRASRASPISTPTCRRAITDNQREVDTLYCPSRAGDLLLYRDAEDHRTGHPRARGSATGSIFAVFTTSHSARGRCRCRCSKNASTHGSPQEDNRHEKTIGTPAGGGGAAGAHAAPPLTTLRRNSTRKARSMPTSRSRSARPRPKRPSCFSDRFTLQLMDLPVGAMMSVEPSTSPMPALNKYKFRFAAPTVDPVQLRFRYAGPILTEHDSGNKPRGPRAVNCSSIICGFRSAPTSRRASPPMGDRRAGARSGCCCAG